MRQDVGPFPKEEDRILSRGQTVGEEREGAWGVALRNRDGGACPFSLPFAC